MLSVISIALISTIRFVSADNDSGSEYILNKDQVIKQTLFKASSKITIDGEVNGDVYLIGKTIDINGKINGNVFVAGEKVNFGNQATVSNSIFVAGEEVVNGSQSVGSNYVFASKFTTSSLFTTAGSLLAFVQDSTISGNILGDLFATGNKMNLEATVARSSRLEFTNLKISENAKLLDLQYRAQNSDVIADNKSILGNLEKLEARQEKTASQQRQERVRNILFGMFGNVLFCLFIYKLIKGKFNKVTEKVLSSPFKHIGLGFLAMLVTPLIFISLFVLGFAIGFKFLLLFVLLLSLVLLLSKTIVILVIANKLALKLSKNNDSNNVGFAMLALSLVIIFLVEVLLSFSVMALALFNSSLVLWGISTLISLMRNKNTITPIPEQSN